MDKNPIGDTLNYVGYITNIIALTYGHLVEVKLLRVQWYRPMVKEDVNMGVLNLPHNALRARDESSFQVINMTHLVPLQEELFCMVEHVAQAILCPIDDEPYWYLVIPLESKFSYLANMVDTLAEPGDGDN